MSTADLLMWDAAGASSFTALTNPETNLDGSTAVSVVIDQNNDDIYVMFMVPELVAFPGESQDIVYRLSTDTGSTWGSQVTLNTSVSSDALWVFGGHSVNNFAIKPTWMLPMIRRIMVRATAAADSVGAAVAPTGVPVFETTSYKVSSEVETSTFERPRDCNVDDLLVMIVQIDTTGATVVLDLPSGWTQISKINSNTSTNRNAAMICYRLVESDEATTYTITCNLGGHITNAAIFRFSGVDATTPIHVSVIEAQQSPEVPAITTTLTNCIIIRGGLHSEGAISTVPASHTYKYGSKIEPAGIVLFTIDAAATVTLAAEDIIGGVSPDDTGYSIAIHGAGGAKVQPSISIVWVGIQKEVLWKR